MKTNYYELFDNGTPGREESVENVRILTLRKLEQARTRRRTVRPLSRVLITAVLVLVLVGSAFAVPAIINALNSLQNRQGGNPVVLLNETGMHLKEGYLEITPEVSVNPDAPKQIETWFVPSACSEWEKLTLYYTTDTAPTMRQDACFAWKTAEDGYVLLRQTPLGSWAAGAVYETVSLGFGNDYTIEQRQYGEITARCIVVPPSEADERVSKPEDVSLLIPARYGSYCPDTPWVNPYEYGMQFDDSEGFDNTRLYYRGLQRLYWSDGDYLFSLEVNYDMPAQTVEAIVENMIPVDDVAPYVQLEYVVPVAQETAPVSEVLFPTAVPEGWELAPTTGSGSDGDRCWVWSCGDMSGMVFNQTTNLDVYDTTMLDWLGSTEDWTRAEVTVQGNPATAFESETEACLLWKTDKECFVLQSSGPEHLDIEALLKIAESLKPV